MRRHLTYSNVIASLALFIALGGISWAAATAPKNSVASKSIKKNAVTNAKIKNNAVNSRKIKSSSILSSDVKNDALTGVDINEGTLGTVPSASSAGTASVAGTATDQFNAFKTLAVSASNIDPNVARDQATEIPLVSHGSVSVYAKCFRDSDGNLTYYETYGRTSANGSVQGGYSAGDELNGDPASLNVNTLEVNRQLLNDAAGPAATDSEAANEVSILGPDGKGLFLSIQGHGAEGNLPDPSPLLPNGNSCLFHYRGSTIG